jgi:hypothetical protein
MGLIARADQGQWGKVNQPERQLFQRGMIKRWDEGWLLISTDVHELLSSMIPETRTAVTKK